MLFINDVFPVYVNLNCAFCCNQVNQINWLVFDTFLKKIVCFYYLVYLLTLEHSLLLVLIPTVLQVNQSKT